MVVTKAWREFSTESGNLGVTCIRENVERKGRGENVERKVDEGEPVRKESVRSSSRG